MTATRIDAIRSRHPEWCGWLDVVASALAACVESDRWIRRPTPKALEGAPNVVAAMAKALDFEASSAWLTHLARRAAASGLPRMQSLEGMRFSVGEATELFDAEMDADDERLGAFSQRIGIDLETLRAVSSLFVMPMAHACRRTELAQEVARNWSDGYCACCSAWPAMAEVCGIERERRLACGRCGSNWAYDVLACAYCGSRDHSRLQSFVVDSDGTQSSVEACDVCRGYLKQVRVLTPTAPKEVLLQDLDSVDLDIVATERGYVRPRGVGRSGSMLIER